MARGKAKTRKKKAAAKAGPRGVSAGVRGAGRALTSARANKRASKRKGRGIPGMGRKARAGFYATASRPQVRRMSKRIMATARLQDGGTMAKEKERKLRATASSGSAGDG